ncbi:MAG: hypothetical protein MJ210_02475 [Alphaproteobacteria bacterium]|nr:hypothetical protein [Alphaproteobacteria bacterium]
MGATTGAISGAISASGIGLVGQMAWGAGINVANTVIDKTIIKKQKLAASDLVEIGFDAVAGAGSALVSYGITKAASKSADKLVCKGVNKIVKAEQKAIQGQRYTNGAMKRGSKLLAEGIKQSNIVKGKSSIISSALTGCYSRAKYRVRGSLFQCRR